MQRSRLPVESVTAFPNGVMVLRVSRRTRFGTQEQEIDEDSGRPVWTVEGYDVAAMYAAPIETKDGRSFREPAEVKVYVIADREPPIPTNQVNGLRGVAQFDGLMVTPWQDTKKCHNIPRDGEGRPEKDENGRELQCGCRVKFSFRAYGMEPVRG